MAGYVLPLQGRFSSPLAEMSMMEEPLQKNRLGRANLQLLSQVRGASGIRWKNIPGKTSHEEQLFLEEEVIRPNFGDVLVYIDERTYIYVGRIEQQNNGGPSLHLADQHNQAADLFYRTYCTCHYPTPGWYLWPATTLPFTFTFQRNKWKRVRPPSIITIIGR
jgi:hypothetical protein